MQPRDVLRRYPLFAVLDPPWLDAWLGSGTSVGVDLGDTLFQAGTPGAHVYLVRQGKVRVLRTTKAGGEISVGSAGPGDLLGEYSLVPPGLNTATCRAAGPGQVLRLPLGPLPPPCPPQDRATVSATASSRPCGQPRCRKQMRACVSMRGRIARKAACRAPAPWPEPWTQRGACMGTDLPKGTVPGRGRSG
jgi:hypothetical protein